MKNYGLQKIISQVDRDLRNKSSRSRYDFEFYKHRGKLYRGDKLRLKTYEIPVVYGFKGRGGRIKKDDSGDEKIMIDKRERFRTERKIGDLIYELANENFSTEDEAKMCSVVAPQRITEVKEANEYYIKFIRKLYSEYGKFDYLAVIQFQDNGRVHHHTLWNMQCVLQKDLLKIWGKGKGSVDVRLVYDVDDLGAYLLGYLDKGISDKRLYGNKAYLCSKGLKRAKDIIFDTDEDLEKFYKEGNIKKSDIARKLKSYESESNGRVDVVDFNLKQTIRGKEARARVLNKNNKIVEVKSEKIFIPREG